jgi:hypothetical protein
MHRKPLDNSRRPVRAIVLTLLLLCHPSTKGDESPVTDPSSGSFDTLLEKIGDDFKTLDWSREARNIDRVLRRVWQRNGWSEESDRFAMELARDVSAIPPWEFMKRLDLASQRVAERYGLSPGQTGRIQGLALREVSGLLLKHHRLILKQAAEFIELRRDNRPYTPEIVAEWVTESKVMVEQFEVVLDRMIREIVELVPEEKRAVFQSDVDSYQKRKVFFDQMAHEWERGGWHPADWGLEDDPAYAELLALPGPRVARTDRPARSGNMANVNPAAAYPKWLPHDPSTWFAYVLEQQRRYRFDPGQFTTAQSIHDELLLRATEYIKSRNAEMDAVPADERSKNELYEPVCGLFNELKERLDAIPSSTQRSDAPKP